MKTSIIIDVHYTGCQHSTPFILNASRQLFLVFRCIVVPWVIKGYDFILRESEVVPNLLEIHYRFCKIEYTRIR
jgi:hypothetical protein